jgi:hypothetical protein
MAVQRPSVPRGGHCGTAWTQAPAVARAACKTCAGMCRQLRGFCGREGRKVCGAVVRDGVVRDALARQSGIRRGGRTLCSGFIHMTKFHDAS